jgi:class 3 adenylate cyclase/tetratricopeptide (TPR) repeat protein
MNCKSCGFHCELSANFCPVCGTQILKSCPNCAHANLVEGNFCSNCGHNLQPISVSGRLSAEVRTPASPTDLSGTLSAEGERRYATVLRADLSAYSVLTESLGPERVQELFDCIKDIATKVIADHGGFINQFRGDEIIALFGFTASENAARDAVQAALDLHEQIREFGRQGAESIAHSLSMHTGICTGLIVIRPSADRDGVFTVSGDAINTAARLVGLAVPNEIIIASDTRRWIESLFNLEQLPPTLVKGKEHPITPYRVLSPNFQLSPFGGRFLRSAASFEGRHEELNSLKQCLARARGGSGNIVAISAHAGLGKSRLVYEFLRGVPSDEVKVLTSRCAPAGENTPYRPWVDIVRQILRVQPSAGVEERVSKILEGCMELALEPERNVAALCHLLAAPSLDNALTAIARGPARQHMLWQALISLIRRSLKTCPLILVLEDWHWADRASDQFLRHHLGHFSSLPILIIVTFRPTPEVSWPIQDHFTAVSLSPLERGAISSMIGSIFGLAQAPEWFTALLQERTGGNPLFIEEIVRSLKEESSVTVQNGELSITKPLPSIGIPDTVQSAVLGRLDRLEPSWRDILRRAAVIGPEFSLAVLMRIVGSEVDLHQTISELEELGFVAQLRDEPESVFVFKHAIIQAVAYETLLLKQRRDLHGRVARAIEELSGGRVEEYCEPLAYHYSRDDDLDRAVRYLEQAGDRAAQSFALDSARNHFGAAIGILAGDDPAAARRRVEISFKWAAASQFATNEEHIDLMRRALVDASTLGDVGLISNCHYWLGRMYYGRGEPTRAVPEFEMVLRNAAHLNDDRLIGRAYCVLGRISLFTAEPRHGVELLRKGIPILRKIEDTVEVIYSISSHACIKAFTGKFTEAETLFADALLLARRYNDRTNEALVLQQLSYARCLRGDWQPAIEAASNCLDISKRGGLPVLAAFAAIFHGYASWMQGERETGYNIMVQAIQNYQNTGFQLAASLCHGWCAEIFALHGDLTRAQIHADLSMEKDKFGDRFGQLPAYRAIAHIASQSGRPAEMEEALKKALELGKSRGAIPDVGITHFHAAELKTLNGDNCAGARHRSDAREVLVCAKMPWWVSCLQGNEGLIKRVCGLQRED